MSKMGALLLAEHSVGATLTETATAVVDKSATSLQLEPFATMAQFYPAISYLWWKK